MVFSSFMTTNFISSSEIFSFYWVMVVLALFNDNRSNLFLPVANPNWILNSLIVSYAVRSSELSLGASSASTYLKVWVSGYGAVL